MSIQVVYVSDPAKLAQAGHPGRVRGALWSYGRAGGAVAPDLAARGLTAKTVNSVASTEDVGSMDWDVATLDFVPKPARPAPAPDPDLAALQTIKAREADPQAWTNAERDQALDYFIKRFI